MSEEENARTRYDVYVNGARVGALSQENANLVLVWSPPRALWLRNLFRRAVGLGKPLSSARFVLLLGRGMGTSKVAQVRLGPQDSIAVRRVSQ